MTVAATTIGNWSRQDNWQVAPNLTVPLVKKITPLADNFEDIALRVEEAGQSIGSAALDNIKGAAIAQAKILATLESMPEVLEDDRALSKFSTLIRSQSEVAKTLQLAWQSLEVAGRIAEFMAENVSLEIEFEEYGESELAGDPNG